MTYAASSSWPIIRERAAAVLPGVLDRGGRPRSRCRTPTARGGRSRSAACTRDAGRRVHVAAALDGGRGCVPPVVVVGHLHRLMVVGRRWAASVRARDLGKFASVRTRPPCTPVDSVFAAPSFGGGTKVIVRRDVFVAVGSRRGPPTSGGLFLIEEYGVSAIEGRARSRVCGGAAAAAPCTLFRRSTSPRSMTAAAGAVVGGRRSTILRMLVCVAILNNGCHAQHLDEVASVLPGRPGTPCSTESPPPRAASRFEDVPLGVASIPSSTPSASRIVGRAVNAPL